MEPFWNNRRVQRSALLGFIFISVIVVFLYGRDNWPSMPTGIHNNERVTTPTGPEEEPLYAEQEYDPAHMPEVPATKPSSHAGAGASGLDSSRVAMIIETRPSGVLPALISHFIATLPPAWIVQMVGTPESFSIIHKAHSLKQHITSQKLQLKELPSHWLVDSSEHISQTLTNLTFYSEVVAPAEWVLMFQTDSIICSASEQSIDDWVAKKYSWVGAPWNYDVPGGNGGLSLRHIPSIVEVLKKDSRPHGHRQWEDSWICERLTNTAPPAEEVFFSVESLYVERPLGYHIRGSAKLMDPLVWSNKTRRRQIFDYCPETKILLGNMGLEPMNDRELREEEIKADAEKARLDAGGKPQETKKAADSTAAPKPTGEGAAASPASKVVGKASSQTATTSLKVTGTPARPSSAEYADS